MSTAPWLVALAFVALALSGCAGPPEPPGGPLPTGDGPGGAGGTGGASDDAAAGTTATTVAEASIKEDDAPVPDADAFRAAHEASWMCRTPVEVDDLNTSANGGLICTVALDFTSTHAVVTASGVPHHDLQSGPGCCASDQDYTWKFPLTPRYADAPETAYLRGPVATAANGVAIFGPEDGPGGDAVANHEGQYEEDRQHIWLGLCHGHSGPGGQYHYHADGNCVHWHPGSGEDWTDYSWEEVDPADVTGIIGWSFDGFPIQGLGELDGGSAREVTSSYRLTSSGTGYGGIVDYEYVDGLGDLDRCNGHFGVTPEFPDGVYHYHSVRVNGDGELGFPYFVYCYVGVVEEANLGYGSTNDVTAGPDGGMDGGAPPEGGEMPPPEGGGGGGEMPPPEEGGSRPPPPPGGGGGQPPPP